MRKAEGYLFSLFCPVLLVVAAFPGLLMGLAGALTCLFACPLLDRALDRQLDAHLPRVEPFWELAVCTLFAALFFPTLLWSAHKIDDSLSAYLAFSVTWGVLGGIPGLILGHILIHCRVPSLRKLGNILFACILYPGFPFFHLQGHHRRTASTADYHAASRNQTLFDFFVRALREESRHARKDLRLSQRLTFFGLSFLALASVLAVRPAALLPYLAACFFARLLIQQVNYVQHYGLTRQPGAKLESQHSWDLSRYSTNLAFFRAGHHSAHHCEPGNHGPSSPGPLRLPYDFPVMLAISMIPPVFFRVMNPLLPTEKEL